MKKLSVIVLLSLMLSQTVQVYSRTMPLSVSDFTPKRAAFCEIFVEPN
ncbi:MAG TPA: hypothetical protein PL190_01950 [Caldisericia bacterium]|nr:hypothetical protein [Caldisericia bacterium]MCE5177174.1 hypothetical protein [bacterium]OQB71009.1 MAG: hypothetical protein BWX90_01278 [bacterium ADurb.Bin132]HNW32400.1 hypothetical protein [Caldisericia bacterium]HNY60757.1 hypothetical protein [Caldisericia bacterium]